MKQKSFQNLFKSFWKDWRSEKNKCTSLNRWWESGKMYFKIIAIKVSTIKNQKINKDLQNLTNNVLQEKRKNEPDKTKIETWQALIDNIENYKIHGTIIRSKEMSIINEEIPNKYFYLKEQQTQAKKQIKQLQNEKNETLRTNLEILQEF